MLAPFPFPLPVQVPTPKAALVLAAFALWAAASTYWYDCRIKRVCAQDAALTEAADPGDVSADDPLTFNFADARVHVGPAFATFKAKVLAALHEDEVLVAVGQYTAEEQAAAGNPAPDLGQQRAAQTLALFADALPAARRATESRLASDPRQLISRTHRFASVGFTARALPPVQLTPAPILFPVGKARRHQTDGTRAYLQAVAAQLAAGSRATIEGFVDPRGQDDTNYELARERAASIRDELVRYGAPIDRIELVVDSQPRQVGDNSTVLGRQQNRRVEITLR